MNQMEMKKKRFLDISDFEERTKSKIGRKILAMISIMDILLSGLLASSHDTYGSIMPAEVVGGNQKRFSRLRT